MELSILKDIVVIFALSTLVNLVFTKIKIPTVVGYLMTGVIAGPHLLSLVKGTHDIEILAEIGVVLLLFTIGMEFSLRHLLRIRRIVFFGGLLQVFITAAVFYLISGFYEINWQGGVLVGFLVALSSSALVLKLLQERSELTSNYGRTILGILIFQDLLLVPLLLFTDFLGSETVEVGNQIVLLLLKAILVIGMVYVGNRWLLPKLLHLIALAKNQELFIMSILLICLAVALFTSELGMSLAFGAFLAGLMVSESEYSHNAFANLVPFKDIFTSFFFVSIGMLLDISFIAANIQLVFITVLLVIVVKTLVAGTTGFILGHTFRGTILVGLALSQVGEFSFILAKIGLNLEIISDFYYKLFLAVAVISLSTTPFLMRASLPLANLLLRLPLPNFIVNGLFPLKEMIIPDLKGHLVIIGKDTSAIKLSRMAKLNNIQHVSVIFDPSIAREKISSGDLAVYGDAINAPILHKAHTEKADTVVISVGSVIPSMAIVERVRQLNQNAFILVRAKQTDNIEQLYKLGADQVFPEKLEIAIDLFNRVLTRKKYPKNVISRILTEIRELNLGEFMLRDKVNQPSIFDEFSSTHIHIEKIAEGSFAEGKSISDINLRKKTGVTLLAIKRNNEVMEHPAPQTVLCKNDHIYLMGSDGQLEQAVREFFEKQMPPEL